MYKFLVWGMLSLLLIGCGNSNNTDGSSKPRKPKTEMEMRGAKFSSMNRCLDSIEKETKLSLEVVTDKPNEVSGFLNGTKRGFACQVEESGTEGTYVKGWYMVEVEVY